jgi:hypothetical protein
MPIARGSFEINFSNFKGVFDANGFEVHVEGRVSQSIQTVNVRNAQVEYADLSDFLSVILSNITVIVFQSRSKLGRGWHEPTLI